MVGVCFINNSVSSLAVTTAAHHTSAVGPALLRSCPYTVLVLLHVESSAARSDFTLLSASARMKGLPACWEGSFCGFGVLSLVSVLSLVLHVVRPRRAQLQL